MNLQFTLNGKPWSVECEPADTLAEVLRNQLNLNGTKVSCEVQVCGACTVLVDNLPVSACTYLAYEARGKNLLTVEGLEKADGTLHPIQQAFIDEFIENGVQHFELKIIYPTMDSLTQQMELWAENILPRYN